VRILWAKSGGLVPIDHGGKIRSYHLAKTLAQRHELSLFTFYQPFADDPHSELRAFFKDVVVVPLEPPAKKGFAEYAAYGRNLLSTRPYSATKFCQPHVAKELLRHLQEHKYDAIICDFLLTGDVMPWDFPVPKVLFTHNVEAQIWKRHFQVAGNPIWKAVCYREFLMMSRMEERYLKLADHVLAVSEWDRTLFSSTIDPGKISVIATGVDVAYFRPQPELEQRNALVFTGSMDWMPNEDGIFYFVEKVMPRVWTEMPDATLWVVGRRPTEKLTRLEEREPRVKVTGTVPDIRPYLAKGSVYVVPLFVGGGTRLKIFEAMAMGKAVLSTTIGAEGLPVTQGKDIVLADQPEDLARQTVRLLRNEGDRRALGGAARRLVEESFSWTSVGKHLSEVMERVAKTSRQPVTV
jgi:polysaccharide biosynthesis protein PslH